MSLAGVVFMIININDINKGFNKDFVFNNFKMQLQDNIIAVINIKGNINNSSPKYILDADISCVVYSQCDCCLKDIKKDIAFHIKEVFYKSNDLSNNKEDFFFIATNASNIDLYSCIYANILSNLPMKTLCKANCKGLCHVCGADLNKHLCSCKSSYIDPRFEQFLHLFKKEV